MEHLRKHETERRHESAELERAGNERLRELENKHERPERHSKHEAVEAAREQLANVEAPAPSEHTQEDARPVSPSGLTRRISYEHTMKSLQRHLSPASRAFSKAIHTPAVEAVSEAAGKTVLRPSVTLGATTAAVLVQLFLYLAARQYGFVLRGGELWIALIVGGVIGVLIEYMLKSWRRVSGWID